VKHVPIKTHRTEGEILIFLQLFPPLSLRNESEKDVLASECVHHMYMSQNKEEEREREKMIFTIGQEN
jgi:hypothetical protein